MCEARVSGSIMLARYVYMALLVSQRSPRQTRLHHCQKDFTIPPVFTRLYGICSGTLCSAPLLNPPSATPGLSLSLSAPPATRHRGGKPVCVRDMLWFKAVKHFESVLVRVGSNLLLRSEVKRMLYNSFLLPLA